MCQSLLTPYGKPYLLWGVDGNGMGWGEVGGARGGEGVGTGKDL